MRVEECLQAMLLLCCDSDSRTPRLHRFDEFQTDCSHLCPHFFTRLFTPTLILKNMSSRCTSAAEEMPPPRTLSGSYKERSAVSPDVFIRLFLLWILGFLGSIESVLWLYMLMLSMFPACGKPCNIQPNSSDETTWSHQKKSPGWVWTVGSMWVWQTCVYRRTPTTSCLIAHLRNLIS